MPAMPQAKFYAKAKNGEERHMVSKVSVDVEGTFHVMFDDDLRACVKDNLEARTSITTNRNGKFRVSGGDLTQCKSVIEAALKQWMQCELIEEHVIRYGYQTKSSYWKMPSGAIYANGYEAKNDPDYDHDADHAPQNGKWSGRELHATNHAQGYSVALFAKIHKKITYRRGSVDEVELTCPDFDNFSRETYGERLNCFVGLNESGGWRSAELDCEEMPYTEAAAKFFYDMLIGMCTFADRIDTFFTDKDNVVHAIESGRKLLAAPKVKGDDETTD